MCLLFAVAWWVSLRWSIYCSTGREGYPSCDLHNGGLAIDLHDNWGIPFYIETNSGLDHPDPALRLPRIIWWPDFSIARLQGFIPFWMLFGLAAMATSLLWWRDRRPPKGHCQNCGYDLTGNVSGRCPECGEAT